MKRKNETVKDEVLYSAEDGYLVGEFARGYKDENGVYHTLFVYRDMDGEDEEALGKGNIRNDNYKIAETLLMRCLMQIGSIDKKAVSTEEWRDTIKSLAIGDQDIAILKIREEAVGGEITVKHTCPSCGSKLESVVGTNELNIIPFSGVEDIEFDLPKGYRLKSGKLAKKGTIRLPNGYDRQMLADMASKDVSKANSLLLVRTITSLDGVEPITTDVVKKFSLKDRKYLIELIKDNSFGVDTNIELTCPQCGVTTKAPLQVLNFM